MVQIINSGSPIQTSGPTGVQYDLSGTLEQLGKVFADPLTPEVKRRQIAVLAGKAVAQDRENKYTMSLSDRVRRGDYAPNEAAADGIAAGVLPTTVAGYDQYVNVKKFGAGSKEATDATMSVPGSSFGSTVQGKREDLANARTIKGMEELTKLRVAAQNPTNVFVPDENGSQVPIIVRQDQSYGHRAAVGNEIQKGAVAGANAGNLEGLNPTQKRYIGADVKADSVMNATTEEGTVPVVKNEGPGFSNAQTGVPVTQPITAVGRLNATEAGGLTIKDPQIKALNDTRIATNQAVASIDRLTAGLSGPEAAASVGMIGKSASIFNGLRAQVEAGVRLAGGVGFADEVATVGPKVNIILADNPQLVAKAQSLGIRRDVLHSQIQSLAYMISKANDPGGRQSDGDIERATAMIGGSLGDPDATTVVLNQLKHELIDNQAIREKTTETTYGKKFGVGLNTERTAPPSLTPASGPAAGPAEGMTATNPQTGEKIIFRGGQWVPQ